MKKSVGIMIQDTVRDKHIKQRALGRGLCSIGDLSKFLNGTKRMDCLLMTALLQRIGKSAANFSVLLTEEEYIYFDWRHQMCLAQLERDWKRMEQLLEENAEIYRTLNETLQRQYVLLSVLGENPINSEETLFLMDAGQEVELLQQTLSVSRQEQKRTQESLCEGICEPETISRIERGKHMPHPKTYAALAKRLNLPTQKYYSSIETGDFRILELLWKMENHISRRKWEDAEMELQMIRGRLDVATDRNRQYLEEIQYLIDKQNDAGDFQQRMERMLFILRITMPKTELWSWEQDEFWKHFFTKTEMSVLMDISDEIYRHKEYAKAVQLLERMYSYYVRKNVAQEFHYKITLLIVARLTSALLRCKEYEKAITYIEQGINISFKCCNQSLVGGLVNNWADALEQLGQKKKALELYRLAYYYDKLMESGYAQVSKASYENLLGRKVDWD